MEKVCLIIDDNPQDDVLERLVESARKKGVLLKCVQYNVGSTERSDLLNAQSSLDLAIVLEKFKTEFAGTKLDIICIDFQLEDENVNGLDVLRSIYDSRRSSQFMIYSSNLDQVVKGIISNYDKDKNKSKLIAQIKSLTKFKIVDFAARDRYDEAILEIISHNEASIDLILESKLLEYPDMVFEKTYPYFDGLTLEQIATEIRIDSVRGRGFKEEIIEQAIATMIKMNSNGVSDSQP